MARYRVRFSKILCDDTGHPRKCLEGVVDIRHARNHERALQAAKRRFERMKRVARWNLYADTVDLEIEPKEVPPPRRALPRLS